MANRVRNSQKKTIEVYEKLFDLLAEASERGDVVRIMAIAHGFKSKKRYYHKVLHVKHIISQGGSSTDGS